MPIAAAVLTVRTAVATRWDGEDAVELGGCWMRRKVGDVARCVKLSYPKYMRVTIEYCVV